SVSRSAETPKDRDTRYEADRIIASILKAVESFDLKIESHNKKLIGSETPF
ncbi:Hypothetical protein CINCED_3A023903, partial [Cinara cedri]